jgi:Tfp pilus assembly protein FimT
MLLIIAIIGILAAFALPNILRARKCPCMEACIANTKQLEATREQALRAGNASQENIPFGSSVYTNFSRSLHRD